MDRNKILHDLRHLRVPSGASKMISELTVRSAQTVHLSWIKISTISKLREMSFQLSLVTQDYHPLCTISKLRQIVQLSCTKTNTISKRIKTRFYMTHVTKEFHLVRPKRFLKLWYVWCKLWTYVAPILTLSPNVPKRDSTWPTSPWSYIRCVQNNFRAYGTFGANRAPILNQD
jgi:hypothetical protein